MNLRQNVFYGAIIQGANYIFPLITIPLLTRNMSISDYGLIGIGMGLVSFSNIILDYGFSIYGVRNIAIKKSRENIKELYSISIVIKLFIWFFIVLLCFFLVQPQINMPLSVMFIYLLAALLLSIQPVWIFQGLENISIITKAVIFAKSTYLLMIIMLFIFGDIKPLNVASSFFISQLFSFIIYSYILKKDFSIYIVKVKIKKIKFIMYDCWGYFSSRLFVSTYTAGNVIILGFFISSKLIAPYVLAELIYRILQSFFSPINQVLLPYITREKSLKKFKKIFFLNFSLAVIIFMFLYFISPIIITSIFGDEYLDTVKYLKFFLIIFLVNIPCAMAGYPLFSIINNTNIVNKTNIFGGIIFLLFLSYFGIVMGTRDAYFMCYSILMTEVFVCLLRVIVFYFKYKDNKNVKM